jgi:hypothetical protein
VLSRERRQRRKKQGVLRCVCWAVGTARLATPRRCCDGGGVAVGLPIEITPSNGEHRYACPPLSLNVPLANLR